MFNIWSLVRGPAIWLALMSFVLSDPWDALSAAPQVRAPAWVVNGADDDVLAHRNLPKLGLIDGLSVGWADGFS